MRFDAIHALQTGAVVSLYRRTLLVRSAAALSHIAVIVAVTLPQLYLQPTSLFTQIYTHVSLQADPSSSEPQLDSAVAGPPVPALPAAPAAPPSVPAAPDAVDVPADAGNVAGQVVQTAREERHKVCHLLCASITL